MHKLSPQKITLFRFKFSTVSCTDADDMVLIFPLFQFFFDGTRPRLRDFCQFFNRYGRILPYGFDDFFRIFHPSAKRKRLSQQGYYQSPTRLYKQIVIYGGRQTMPSFIAKFFG